MWHAEDLAETENEIHRYHRLSIVSQHNGGYRIEGATLDQRLCLLHWLRRALRLCPQFITQYFTPALKTALRQQGIARTLYDDTNLRALINAPAACNAPLSAGIYNFCVSTCNIAYCKTTMDTRRSSTRCNKAGRRCAKSIR